MKQRLFAVKAPELPLDITDELLWRWSKQTGRTFIELTKNCSANYAKETNNVWEFSFSVYNYEVYKWEEIKISMDSNQMLEVMREVKEKGVVHKDLRWGTSYIEKEFKPEAANK